MGAMDTVHASAERIRRLFTQKELACGRFVRATARSQGLSEAETQALLRVARHGEISAGLLRLRGGLSPQVAGALANRLVARGLLERHRHRGDRRTSLLRLTAEGEAVLQVALAPLTRRIDEVFEALPLGERQVVARYLARVADATAVAAGEAEVSSFPDQLAATG